MPALTITLNGTPALIRLSLETPILAAGTAGTSKLDVNAYDASGALIVAPGTFTTPLTVASDSTAVSLSGTSAASPGTQITITYGGGAAPYAIHLTGTGGGIAANLIVNATLNVAPAMSLAFLSEEQSISESITAINALNEPPQRYIPFPSFNQATEGIPGSGGFAPLASGYTAVATTVFGAPPTCHINVYTPGGAQAFTPQTTFTGSNIASFCAVGPEANGDILFGDNGGGGGSELTENSVSGTGILTATGRTILLSGAQLSPAPTMVAPVSIAANAAGTVAVLASAGASYYLLIFAPGASGAATPTVTTLTVPANGNPVACAIAPDGTLAVLYVVFNTPNTYVVQKFTAGGATNGTITPPSLAAYISINGGIAIDSADDVLVGWTGYQATSSYGTQLDLFPAAATGAVSPQTTVPLSVAPGVSNLTAGPIIVASPAPAAVASPVAGDMLGYAPNRTWTYQSFGQGGGYVGIYADPQLVSGNVRLVAFESATTGNLFTVANEIGSADFAPLDGGYQAVAFTSISSGVAGIAGPVPGSPLFVPQSLSVGQVWNPEQNAAAFNVTGLSASAQVVAIGPAIGGAATACSAASLPAGNAATVAYSGTSGGANSGGALQIQYIPGCGMVAVIAGGGYAALQSVGVNTGLGQLTVALKQPPWISELHKMWQHLFNVSPPH